MPGPGAARRSSRAWQRRRRPCRPAASSCAAVRARSICRTAPCVSPVAARNRRSTVRPGHGRTVTPQHLDEEQVAGERSRPGRTSTRASASSGSGVSQRAPSSRNVRRMVSGSPMPPSTRASVGTVRNEVPRRTRRAVKGALRHRRLGLGPGQPVLPAYPAASPAPAPTHPCDGRHPSDLLARACPHSVNPRRVRSARLEPQSHGRRIRRFAFSVAPRLCGFALRQAVRAALNRATTSTAQSDQANAIAGRSGRRGPPCRRGGYAQRDGTRTPCLPGPR